MRKLTKIVAPALVALLGIGSLAPAVAEAAPRHHEDRRAYHRPVYNGRHHVEQRRSHHRVSHRASQRYYGHNRYDRRHDDRRHDDRRQHDRRHR